MTTYIVIIAAILIIGYLVIRQKSNDSSSYTNISVNDLANLMKDKSNTLIDVRTKREISQGKIGKPLTIELGPSMQKKMANLDKSKKYIVYCRSGNRSAQACKMMVGMGFQDVVNLAGGYNAWSQK